MECSDECFLTSFLLENIGGAPCKKSVVTYLNLDLNKPPPYSEVWDSDLDPYGSSSSETEIVEPPALPPKKISYKCDGCSRVFSTNDNLLFHSCYKYRCDECPEVFVFAIELMHHKMRHRDNYPCRECDKEFGTKRGLSSHLKIHRDNPITHPYKCSRCSNRYQSKSSLNRHSKTHKW